MKVAVVGAGIHGSCAALELADGGHQVTLFEQFSLGHVQGSTVGRSRIVRQHYPDPYWTRILLEGHGLWKGLQQRLGEQIYHECGLLYFGPREDPNMRSGLSGLNDCGVPHKVLRGPHQCGGIELTEGEDGVLTPGAGWVQADRTLRGLHRLCGEAGVEIESPAPIQRIPAEFDRAIVCPGPWVKDWLPDSSFRITKQTYAYIRGEHQGPVWIESGPHSLYGFPNEPGADCFKAGVHEPGRPLDPNEPDRRPDSGDLEILKDLAQRRFGISDPEIVEAGACLYTRTPTEDFRVAWKDGRTLVVSACSGHGFKFGPWLGRFAADAVEGRRDLADWPRFAAAS